jgi:hypothetical protein
MSRVRADHNGGPGFDQRRPDRSWRSRVCASGAPRVGPGASSLATWGHRRYIARLGGV